MDQGQLDAERRVEEAEAEVLRIKEETFKERTQLQVRPLIALCSTAACTAGTLRAVCVPLLLCKPKAGCIRAYFFAVHVCQIQSC